MEEMKLMVPTYNSKWLKGTDIELADFDEPLVPVLIHQAEGVRVALGTHEHPDYDKPDIQIERRHNGWMIFLNPRGGSDASGYVAFLDDGRSFVAKQNGLSPTAPIRMVEYKEAIAELDDILPSGPSCAPTMVVQKRLVDDTPMCDQSEPTSVQKRSVQDTPKCDQPEPTSDQPVQPLTNARLYISEEVIDAFKSAQEALVGDSNDDKHDALWALVEAIGVYRLGEFKTYCSEWIVSDFCGWAGLDSDERPDEEDIEIYVREARPADSSPLDVNGILHDWVDTLPRNSARRRRR